MTTNSKFDDKKFADAYPPGIENSFWSVARNKILSRALNEAARKGLRSTSGSVLEVGCGTGVVVQGLRQNGHDASGVELSSPPHLVTGASEHVTINTAAQDLRFEIRERIETLLFLDVIEHIENDSEFIREIVVAFPACRCVILTVPARPEIWSDWDEYYGHHRRYTPANLKTTLETGMLKPAQLHYFFRSLYVAAWLIKKSGRTRSVSVSRPGYLFVQKIIARILVAEHLMLRKTPARGLSLLAIAEPIVNRRLK